MIRKIITVGAMALVGTVSAQENQSLEVMFDSSGCPTQVESHDDSCGQGGDPVNRACRNSGGPVRWGPVASIAEINTKEGSAGALKNCQAKSGYYQCIVTGNGGDEVEYYVTSTQGCKLDPVIIINR